MELSKFIGRKIILGATLFTMANIVVCEKHNDLFEEVVELGRVKYEFKEKLAIDGPEEVNRLNNKKKKFFYKVEAPTYQWEAKDNKGVLQNNREHSFNPFAEINFNFETERYIWERVFTFEFNPIINFDVRAGEEFVPRVRVEKNVRSDMFECGLAYFLIKNQSKYKDSIDEEFTECSNQRMGMETKFKVPSLTSYLVDVNGEFYGCNTKDNMYQNYILTFIKISGSTDFGANVFDINLSNFVEVTPSYEIFESMTKNSTIRSQFRRPSLDIWLVGKTDKFEEIGLYPYFDIKGRIGMLRKAVNEDGKSKIAKSRINTGFSFRGVVDYRSEGKLKGGLSLILDSIDLPMKDHISKTNRESLAINFHDDEELKKETRALLNFNFLYEFNENMSFSGKVKPIEFIKDRIILVVISSLSDSLIVKNEDSKKWLRNYGFDIAANFKKEKLNGEAGLTFIGLPKPFESKLNFYFKGGIDYRGSSLFCSGDLRSNFKIKTMYDEDGSNEVRSIRSGESEVDSPVVEKLPGYMVVNCGVSKKIFEDFEVTVELTNLLNSKARVTKWERIEGRKLSFGISIDL